MIYLFNALDHVFHTNIIAYCQQNQYVRFAIYTDPLNLNLGNNVHLRKYMEGMFAQNWLSTALSKMTNTMLLLLLCV